MHWRSAGSPAADLYRGTRLQAVLDWRRDHPDDLTADEAAFVDASEQAADAELVQARTRADRERRGRRRLRRVALGPGRGPGGHDRRSTSFADPAARSSADQAAAAARQDRHWSPTPDGSPRSPWPRPTRPPPRSWRSPGIGYRIPMTPARRCWRRSCAARRPRSACSSPSGPLSMVASPAGDRLYVYEINNRPCQVIDPRTRSIVGELPGTVSNTSSASIDGGRELIVNGSGQRPGLRHRPRPGVRAGRPDRNYRANSQPTTAMLVPDQPRLSPDGRWLVTVNTIDRLVTTPTNRDRGAGSPRTGTDPAPHGRSSAAPVREVAAGPTDGGRGVDFR